MGKVKNTKEQNERNKKILQELLKEEANKECADCTARGPLWASWNLGIFICIKCAGFHRKLGTHISQVRSVTLDEWTPEQMRRIRSMGNAVGKKIYEANLPPDKKKPNEFDDDRIKEQWIRDKYERKLWMAKTPIQTKTSKTVESPKLEKPKKTSVVRRVKSEPVPKQSPKQTPKQTTTPQKPSLLVLDQPPTLSSNDALAALITGVSVAPKQQNGYKPKEEQNNLLINKNTDKQKDDILSLFEKIEQPKPMQPTMQPTMQPMHKPMYSPQHPGMYNNPMYTQQRGMMYHPNMLVNQPGMQGRYIPPQRQPPAYPPQNGMFPPRPMYTPQPLPQHRVMYNNQMPRYQ